MGWDVFWASFDVPAVMTRLLLIAADDGSMRLASVEDLLSDHPFTGEVAGSRSNIHTLLCRHLALWDCQVSLHTGWGGDTTGRAGMGRGSEPRGRVCGVVGGQVKSGMCRWTARCTGGR